LVLSAQDAKLTFSILTFLPRKGQRKPTPSAEDVGQVKARKVIPRVPREAK